VFGEFALPNYPGGAEWLPLFVLGVETDDLGAVVESVGIEEGVALAGLQVGIARRLHEVGAELLPDPRLVDRLHHGKADRVEGARQSHRRHREDGESENHLEQGERSGRSRRGRVHDDRK